MRNIWSLFKNQAKAALAMTIAQSKPAASAPRGAVQADGTLELMVYEEIGENWWDGGGITAKSFKAQMDAAGNYSKILIRINSPGGDAFEGIALFNLIRASRKPVEVYVDGVAASSASIVAMAGDTITMRPNSMLMIHNAWTYVSGYADDMRKTADMLDRVSASIAQTYITRTKNSAADVKALMDAETWMTAQEALDKGFATAIADASAVAAAAGAVRNAAGTCGCACANCVALDCKNCSNADCADGDCVDCPMQANTKALAEARMYTERKRLELRAAANR